MTETDTSRTTRFHALDAARSLAILHMVWFHIHRWSCPPQQIQRAPYSLDWWSLLVVSAPPLFFLCFGCALGMLGQSSNPLAQTRRLLLRALELLCWCKLMFLCELASLGAPKASLWSALTLGKTSGWVEVLDFYAASLLLLPWLLPFIRRLPLTILWVLLLLTWKAGITVQAWPYDAQSQMVHAFLAGASGLRPFPILFWFPIVLIGVDLGRCWQSHPQQFSGRCLIHGLFLVGVVGWLGEGGFSLQDFHLNIVLNGWKHPPHLAYVGLTSANALAWLWVCTRVYGMVAAPQSSLSGPLAALARVGRHSLTLYRTHLLALFWLNSWLHFHEQIPYRNSLLLASLGLVACFPFTVWLETLPRQRRHPGTTVVVLAPLLLFLAWQFRPQHPALTSQQFAALIQDISEPGGDFDSDNWISNEAAYLHPLDRLRREFPPNSVYLGVGPEQNFTYIAELKPCYAFILDIRRGNLLQHLYYKALFELSDSPQEWLSRLLGRRLPENCRQLSYPQWIQKLGEAPLDPPWREEVARQVRDKVLTYGLPLSADDLAYFERIQKVFSEDGLHTHFTFIKLNPGTVHSNFEEILLAKDLHGSYRNFLAVPDSYARLKAMQQENRIIPLIGDFGGTEALARLSSELRRRNLLVGMFYLSNVEDYLMLRGLPDDPMEQFVVNLEGLPSDERSLLLRTHRREIKRSQPYAYGNPRFVPRLQRLQLFIRRFQSGQLRGYPECMQADQLPLEVDNDLAGFHE